MTKTDWTAEEVRAQAKLERRDRGDVLTEAMLTAFADRIEADERAVPVAWRWTQGARVFLTPYAPDRIPRLAVCHADTCIPLFTHPPAQAAQEQPGWKVPENAIAWMTPGGDVSRSYLWCAEHCRDEQRPIPLYLAASPTPPKEN